MWRDTRSTAEALDALPMEVLQAAFWSLDPRRTVAKFALFGGFDPESAEARRFVQLEEWANEGEPLPFPAARELFEDFFAANLHGHGRLDVGGKPVAVPPACRCSMSLPPRPHRPRRGRAARRAIDSRPAMSE